MTDAVDYSNLPVTEVESRLETSACDGILGDPQDIKKRQEKYGINKLTPPPKEPFYMKVYEKVREPIMLLLIAAIGMTIAIREYRDGFVVFIAVFIGVSLAVFMEGRGDKALEALNNFAANIKVKARRNKKIHQIQSENVCVGDLIDLNPGDKIPADGRLVESDGLKIDESILTGESVPVAKHSGIILEKVPLADKKNCAFSGTYVSEGRGQFLAYGVGDNTELGKIAADLNNADDAETPIGQKLAAFGAQLSKACIIITAILFIFQVVKTGDYSFAGFTEAFKVSIALIVAAVPEGLPTMVALTLAFNVLKMKDKKALVRKMAACVNIGNVDVICSDKTGTLTQNKMTVVKAYVDGKYVDPGKITDLNMINNMAINSTADVIEEDGEVKDIGSSSECAMLRCIGNIGHKYKILRSEANIVKVFDFSSDRKMMSTIVDIPGSVFNFTIYSKGAPERILDRCKSIFIDGHIQPLTTDVRRDLESKISDLQSQAMRVLAFAQETSSDKRILEDEDSMIFVGFVGIEDPIRPDVKDAISVCHGAGVDVKMLTGDNKATATAIAKQLGMFGKNSKVFEAKDIEAMSDEELIKVLPDITVIARCTPSLKQRIATLLKRMDKTVAMTGDGVNDAPALKAADVGIAMGITGTEVSKQASDIVLLDDSFSTITTAIMWGRQIYRNFQRFITFQLTVNVVAFVTAFVATLLGLGLPFTTVQLLFINLIMDGLPALSLGLEPPRAEIMKEKPVQRNAKIITIDMLKNIGTNGLFIGISILALMKYSFLGGTPEQQSTIVFSTLVFFALWNSFNCREFGFDSVFPNFFSNKIALVIMVGSALVQIVLVQFAGDWFDSVPLPLEMWGIIIGYTFSVVIFSEVIKLVGALITGKHKSVAVNPQEN